MRMPKPKPDQTIRHEIVLSRPDRELLSDVVVAYQINKVATPIVSLLSDASAMLIVAGLLEAYGITDLIPNTVYDDIVGGIYDTYQGGMAAIEGALEFAEGVGEDFDAAKAAVLNNPIVRTWVWLLTSGRILQSQMGVGR